MLRDSNKQMTSTNVSIIFAIFRIFDVLEGFEQQSADEFNVTEIRFIHGVYDPGHLWSAKQKILVFFWYYDVYLKHKSNHKSNCTT